MKNIKLLALFLILALSVLTFTACKDKNHSESGTNDATNKSEGYDEIEFDKDPEDDNDVVVDFDTGSIITSNNSSTNSDSTSSNTSSGSSSSNTTSENESENASSDNESENVSNDSSTPEDTNSDTTSSDPDKDSMDGWSPWE